LRRKITANFIMWNSSLARKRIVGMNFTPQVWNLKETAAVLAILSLRSAGQPGPGDGPGAPHSMGPRDRTAGDRTAYGSPAIAPDPDRRHGQPAIAPDPDRRHEQPAIAPDPDRRHEQPAIARAPDRRHGIGARRCARPRSHARRL
jgi:hypothetical protein